MHTSHGQKAHFRVPTLRAPYGRGQDLASAWGAHFIPHLGRSAPATPCHQLSIITPLAPTQLLAVHNPRPPHADTFIHPRTALVTNPFPPPASS